MFCERSTCSQQRLCSAAHTGPSAVTRSRSSDRVHLMLTDHRQSPNHLRQSSGSIRVVALGANLRTPCHLHQSHSAPIPSLSRTSTECGNHPGHGGGSGIRLILIEKNRPRSAIWHHTTRPVRAHAIPGSQHPAGSVPSAHS